MTECPYTIASEIILNMGIETLIKININEGDYFISTVCDKMCDTVSDYGADFDEEVLEDKCLEDIVCETVIDYFEEFEEEFSQLLEVSPEFKDFYENQQ